VAAQQVGHHAAEDVAAHPADDGRRDFHFHEIHRGVGRAAADREQHLVRHDQLARRRHVGDRAAHMVGDDDAATKDVGALCHGDPVKPANGCTIMRHPVQPGKRTG